MKKIIAISLIILVLGACDEDTSVIPYEETLIVEGYLYHDEQVENIKLTKLIPLTGDADADYSVNDAIVEITHNEKLYTLILSPGDSGCYHYPGDDLIIEEDGIYELSIEYDGETVSSVTTVPQSPDSLSISQEEIELDPIYDFRDMRNRDIDDIIVEWYNPDASYYYVVLENIEDDPEDVMQDANMIDFMGGPRFRMITEPTQDNFYVIRGMTLEQYGTHKLTLYKVNKEYADLYETSGQDSRDLNEPLNNIHNGLGIFTSFNSDVVYFEVVKP